MESSDEESILSENSASEEVETPESAAKSKKRKLKEDSSEDPAQKKAKNPLYKAPTAEELNELKDLSDLYNNNLFRIQIEELFSQVKIKNKTQNSFTTWYRSFQALIKDLPEYEVVLSSIKSLSPKKKLKVKPEQAFINGLSQHKETIKCDQDLKLTFEKPKSCEIFGLSKINSLPGPALTININLEMPRACFNVNDNLNNRYFVKRYFYLAYIEFYLRKQNISQEIVWSQNDGNNLLPILKIVPKNGNTVEIRINVTPTEEYFRAARFLPNMNNVKIDVFQNSEENIKDYPTISYNSSMARDVTLKLNHDFIESKLGELKSAQEAIKLIKIWLNQRELNSGFGAFTDDLILYFIVYLLMKNRINKHMSSYQIVRNFWTFIKDHDVKKETPSICEELKSGVSEEFQQKHDLVFLDRSGCYNVASFLNGGIYDKIKSECEIALKLVDHGGTDCFHLLFIQKLPALFQYDLVLKIQKILPHSKLLKTVSVEERVHFLGQENVLLTKQIWKSLKKGLSQRATLIVPLPSESQSENASFGINLDADQAFSFLELGPTVNDPKEKEFREFWGGLCSDRRFKDGSVRVAVYFETKTIQEKRAIISRVIEWVVAKTLGLKYNLQFNEWEELCVSKKLEASYPMGTNEEGCLAAITASDELGKKLRNLEMPLVITGVQGISDVFSFTDAFPPISTNYKPISKHTTVVDDKIIFIEDENKKGFIIPRFVKTIECVLQLEHSSKWPKDLDGVRNMKTAFYLQISKLLHKKHGIISSVKPDSIDIAYEGFVFRYHLHVSREIALLKKESINNGVTVYKDSEESRIMEMKLNILPRLMGAFKGVQSQFPSYGPSTALIKRWLRSQLIDDYHFPDLIINFINAALYSNPSPFRDSATPQIGFLRFLKFFADFQYKIHPIILDVNHEIQRETIQQIESKLLKTRDAYPNLYLVTPYDNCESLLTNNSLPSKKILKRVQHLSRETLSVLEANTTSNIKQLLIPNLSGFNAIIQLRPFLNPIWHQQLSYQEQNDEKKFTFEAFNPLDKSPVPITDFNPVQIYLKELRENYGEFANFFYDSYGGVVIGVIWNQEKIQEITDFKVANANGRVLEDGKLICNVDRFIEQFFILGEDLLKSIDIN